MNEQMIFPDDPYDRSPAEVADLYFTEVKSLFPEIFEKAKEGQFAALHGSMSCWIDAITGKEIIGHKDGSMLADESELPFLGYERIANGREWGGSLERFLGAYWWFRFNVEKEIWSRAPSDLFIQGMMLGSALQELGLVYSERHDLKDIAHPGDWLIHD